MKTSIFLLLMGICLESFGAVVIIKGQPTPLEYNHELYYLPANFVIPHSSLFVTIDGLNKVCFLNNSLIETFEQISEINIIVNGVKTEWNCFPYKTTVFEVRP